MVADLLQVAPAPAGKFGCFFGVATVMEETNQGGARACAELIDPEVAVVLEAGLLMKMNAATVAGLTPS